MPGTEKKTTVAAKRFVVYGDDAIARSTMLALTRVISRSRLDYFSIEAAARERLWEAGDSPMLSDKTHFVYVSSVPLMPDQLFRTHCRLRPNDSQDATIDRRGPGWSGGIVFIGPVVRNLEELTKIEPFSRVTVGHTVVPLPFLLKDLLLVMARMRPIYPDAWKDSLMALEGLANLKSVLRNIENSRAPVVEHLEKLKVAVMDILEDRLLDKLLAHREVVGELRIVLASINEAIASRNTQAAAGFLLRIREILTYYL